MELKGLVTTTFLMARFANNLNGSQNLFKEIPENEDF